MKPDEIEDLKMARPKNPNKYVSLDVRVPPEIRDALAAAAKAKFESLSAYTRAALLARLERDGICPIPPHAA